MAMMPKRVLHRKQHRGRVTGNAARGNTVEFGEVGLQSMEAGWLSARQIEAGRVALSRAAPGAKIYIRVFPHKPLTSIPLETRMGKGKGEPEYYAAVIKPGTVRSVHTALRRRARMRGGIASSSTPSIDMEPCSGGKSPARVRKSVDLPAPLGPTRHTNEEASRLAWSLEATIVSLENERLPLEDG